MTNADMALRTAMPRRLVAPPRPAAFRTVEVHRSLDAVADAWAELERVAPCSIYQTRRWLDPWLDTLGQKAGVSPWLVLARMADGRPSALLPLGTRRHGPVKVAAWLGGKDSNAAMALLRPGAGWDGAAVRRLLDEAAAGPGRPDVFALTNQPLAWDGHANPMAALPHRASPSAAYGLRLGRDGQALLAASLSKETRKKLRKKEARLAAMGPLTYRVALGADARRDVLDAFLAQKTARLRGKGLRSEFEAPEMRAFIEAAAEGVELHSLAVGERIVAVYGGAAHGGWWSGMFNSFDADEAVARSSPGDLLLMRVIARACERGLHHLDLGIGEARYKETFCDMPIPLFDAMVPVTARGHAYAAFATLRQDVKRRIKRDDRLLALARRLDALRG